MGCTWWRPNQPIGGILFNITIGFTTAGTFGEVPRLTIGPASSEIECLESSEIKSAHLAVGHLDHVAGAVRFDEGVLVLGLHNPGGKPIGVNAVHTQGLKDIGDGRHEFVILHVLGIWKDVGGHTIPIPHFG